MQCVVFYSTVTDDEDSAGEILSVEWFEDEEGPDDFDDAAPDDCAWLVYTDEETADEIDPSTHWVDTSGTPTVELRPVLYADSVYLFDLDDVDDEVRFEVPAGTTIHYDFTSAETTVVATEDFVFSTTIRGRWVFKFNPPFPNVPLILEVLTDANL